MKRSGAPPRRSGAAAVSLAAASPTHPLGVQRGLGWPGPARAAWTADTRWRGNALLRVAGPTLGRLIDITLIAGM